MSLLDLATRESDKLIKTVAVMRYIEQNNGIFSASDKTLLRSIIQHCVHELEDRSEIVVQGASPLVCHQKSLSGKPIHKEFYFESKKVRMFEVDGLFWWVAKDVCDVLGHSNPTEALKMLDDDEKNTLRISEGTSPKGGNPNVNIINESGLYTLILRSNKPEAKKFRKWVTAEVLPALHRDGAYVSPTHRKTLTVSEKERKLAVREKYAEARKLEALAKNTRALATLAKQNGAILPPGFIEKISEVVNQTIT